MKVRKKRGHGETYYDRKTYDSNGKPYITTKAQTKREENAYVKWQEEESAVLREWLEAEYSWLECR